MEPQQQETAATTAQTAGERVPASEWRDGWPVLASGALAFGMSFVLFVMTAGLFIVPMQEDFGWSRTSLSIGPLIVLIAAPLNLVAGFLVRRFGARLVAMTGLTLLAAGVLMLSLVPPVPLLIYGLAAFIAFVGTLTNAPVYTSGVVTWFSRNAGTAIGLTLSGVSISSFLVIPLLTHIIELHGWRTGYRALAALMLMPLPLLFLWFREKGPRTSVTPGATTPVGDKDLKSAFADHRLWILVAAIGSATIPIGGFVSQLVPLLLSLDFTPLSAAALGSVFALSIGIGRIAAGFLLDHLPPRFVTSSCLALPALGAVMLATVAVGPEVGLTALLAAALIGLAQGAEADFIAFYALRLFGKSSFPVIMSALIAINAIFLALGGFAFARLFDMHHDYDAALVLSIASFSLAAILIFTIRVPRRSKSSN